LSGSDNIHNDAQLCCASICCEQHLCIHLCVYVLTSQ